MIPFIFFILNFCCLINLIIVRYVEIGELSDSNYQWIIPLDILTGLIFIIETFYNILSMNGSFYDKIVNVDRLIEFINIFEIFWFIGGGFNNFILIIFKTIRS